MILSDLNDLGNGSRQPFFPPLKSANFAVDFNHRSNPARWFVMARSIA
jgi:hypothetical protein